MNYDWYYTGDENDHASKVAWSLMLFNNYRVRRSNFEVQWEEAASLCWPEFRNSFVFGHDQWPGTKQTYYQVDSTASIASHRFGAITHSIMTPDYMQWSPIVAGGANGRELMKDRSVKEFFDDITNILWCERYKAEANFNSQQVKNWQILGVFGNQTMYVDELDFKHDPDCVGMRYRSVPIGECYYLIDHQDCVVGMIRHFRRTAQQNVNLFGYENVPTAVTAALDTGSQVLFDVLHFVRPRNDFTPWEIFSKRGMKYTSYYIIVQGMKLVEEGGYRVFPFPTGRYMVAPDEEYGRGPAQMVLPELKTLNAEKYEFLQQGHAAGSPAYLVPETGLLDLKIHAGAFNAGGMNRDGKPLVGVLPVGQIQVTEKMMEMSSAIIGEAFLTELFQLIKEQGKEFQMGPRQVVEYLNERGVMLAPTVGGQVAYLGQLVHRELDVIRSLPRIKLPKMPPALKEARGEYKLEFSGPLARAVRASEVAGTMRTVEFAATTSQQTQRPEIMDIFEFEEIFTRIGEADGMSTYCFASPQSLKAKRDARQQAQQQEFEVKALPGKAAMAKAQAIQSKAQTGGNMGGVLSGTPAGGMPMLPGQTQPGGRAFGQPGPQ